jgi:predicted MPP superfamily phosphohydrolase
MSSTDGSGPFVIAQISDLHCGGPHFLPNLLERAINEVNDLTPDIVVKAVEAADKPQLASVR